MHKNRIIQENDHIVMQNNECIFCYKIEKNKNAKVLSFKIPLFQLIGLSYNSLYLYHDEKFSKIKQSSFQDSFHYNIPEENGTEVLSDEIISENINNINSTFDSRTCFSKFKYIQRKKRKMCLEISFHEPTPCLIWKVMNLRCPNKICYISYQDLANITCLNNINSMFNQNVMIFETCQGLILSSILKKLAGNGNLIQIFNGDFPNRTCLEYYKFSENILRPLCAIKYTKLLLQAKISNNLRPDFTNSYLDEVVDDMEQNLNKMNTDIDQKINIFDEMIINVGQEEKLNRKIKRQEEEIKALDLLNGCNSISNHRSIDCLIIATKFHPTSIARFLIRFLKFSRPFMIYCQYMEPLVDCFYKLKETECVMNMEISETWLRSYQVLPERTHPSIDMNGRTGYFLSGISVDPTLHV